MSGYRAIPPSATALIGSFRGVGYSLETALADLIDNSISAGATNIEILCTWNSSDPVITISDDGSGMSESVLVEAMRFGGTGPDAVRSESDLGRFGLGLKTASFSQSRCLTVFSKTSAGTATFTWDLDEINNTEPKGAWHLIEGGPALPEEVDAQFKSRPSGTVVAWHKIDFGRKTDRPDHAAFMGDLERADKHLGMIFHRFINSDARRVLITINGSKVKAWDPFLETHQATIPLPEKYFDAPGGVVRAKGFVLPHRDRFKNESDFSAAGGPGGWTVQQGFYIYRQKRLLSAGGWLGLGGSRRWTREEPSRLARIQIDIPNTGDQDWRIDIRKAIARPPDKIREKLQLLAEDVRSKARDVFVHRGEYGVRPRQAGVEKIWRINPEGSGRRYAIRRDHHLAALLKGRLTDIDRQLLNALFDLIERTVPVDRVWLDVSEKGLTQPKESRKDALQAGMSMVEVIGSTGVSFEEAAARVAATDPFDLVDDFVGQLRRLRGA